MHGDKGFDCQRLREGPWQWHIQPRIACRGIDSVKGLGRHRRLVERTLAWLKTYRRITIWYEVRDDIHFVFLQLACCLILFGWLI
jgi:hypothetical protein